MRETTSGGMTADGAADTSVLPRLVESQLQGGLNSPSPHRSDPMFRNSLVLTACLVRNGGTARQCRLVPVDASLCSFKGKNNGSPGLRVLPAGTWTLFGQAS